MKKGGKLVGKKRLAKEAEYRKALAKAYIDDEASSEDDLSETKGDKKDQYYDPTAL